LSPGGVICGELTDSSVQVEISAPSDLALSFDIGWFDIGWFDIGWYEVTYTSVIGSYPLTVTRGIAYAGVGQTANDTLANATAGVTYRVSVVSRSGHLTSQQPVFTSCTAGQFALSL